MAFYQSYLMGCAFNMYSQAWSDRSYGVILFLYCFVLPLPVILSSYLGIIYLARSSGDQFEGKNDGDKNPSNENDNEDVKLEQPDIEKTPSHSSQRVIFHIAILGNNFQILVSYMIFSSGIKVFR